MFGISFRTYDGKPRGEFPYDALKAIRDYCKSGSCSSCPYGPLNNNKGKWTSCGFTEGKRPQDWRVKHWKE